LGFSCRSTYEVKGISYIVYTMRRPPLKQLSCIRLNGGLLVEMARHGLGVTSLDDRIFVIGGGPQPGLTVSDANEIYHIGKTS
jgi:hypothetical protein